MATQVLIKKGNTYWDYTGLVSKIVWSGRKGAAPRNCKVTFMDSERMSMVRVGIDVGEGYWMFLKENGKELFRGLCMIETKGSSRTLNVTAYDHCIYLSNNKVSVSYKNKRADQIFKDCCSKCGLSVGGAVNTGKKIGNLTKTGSTCWDIIQEALSQTYSSTGKRYYVYASGGKVYLARRSQSKTTINLENYTNTETFEQTRSIYDTRTRISMVTSERKNKKSWTNTALEKKIGKFADVQTVDKKISKSDLNSKVNTWKGSKDVVSRSLTWKGQGNSGVISGGTVRVVLPTIGVSRFLYVDEDTHTWSNGKHEMSLKLNFASNIDRAG